MASLVQVCFALLLIPFVHGQASNYLGGVTGQCSGGTISSQLSNCSLALHNTLGIASTTDVDVLNNAICTNIEAGVTFNGCLRSAYETCLSSEYFSFLQTDARARDAYQYYCDHRSEINVNCIGSALSSDSCALYAGSGYNAAVSQVGLVQATCNYLEAARGCAFNLGTSCPNHNRNVYDTYWEKSYPPACAGGARSVPTYFLLLGACTVLLNKMAAVFLY